MTRADKFIGPSDLDRPGSLVSTDAHEASDAVESTSTDPLLSPAAPVQPSQVAFYGQLIDSAHDAIIACDRSDRVMTWNAAASRLYGYSALEMLDEPIDKIVPSDRPDELPATFSALASESTLTPFDTIHIRKNGTPVEVAVSVSLLRGRNDDIEGYSLIVRDIAERKAYEEQLRQHTLHDALTGLPNRTLFEDRIDQRLLALDASRETMAVMVLDLDRFRDVTDARGHRFGDALLQEVASRLKTEISETETLARLGGNTFAVLLPLAGNVGAIDVAGRLLSGLERPFQVDGEVVYLSAGLGIAVHPAHGLDTSTLLRKAQAAMYTAKREGSGYAFYADEIDPNSADRLALMAELRQAIKADELVLQYQPQVSLIDGCAEHVEALVRWNHPHRGMLAPDSFIDLAHNAGLMRSLTHWILNESFKQSSTWHDSGIDVNVAVNLSASNLHDRDLIDSVIGLLARWDADPTHFTIEITESALMVDPSRALTTLSRLHDMGMRISIDDFGTGYSSMAYLQRLPIDEIKIDRSFITGMQAAVDDSSIIVRSIVDLGHNLGLEVVAEGVETQQHVDVLASLGCELVQGFHLSPPVDASQYPAWLRSHEERHWSHRRAFPSHAGTGRNRA